MSRILVSDTQVITAFPSVRPRTHYVDSEFRPIEMEVVAQIMRHWFGPRLPGTVAAAWERFPDSYTVLDLETTGFSHGLDLIVEVGWAVVRHREVIDSGSLILNWFEDPRIDQQWLTERIRQVTYHMGNRGRTYHFPPERLMSEGVSPVPALHGFASLIYDGLLTGHLFVGHNLWHFDTKAINSSLHRFLDGYQLPWGSCRILDTGLVEKASQQSRVPWLGETLDGWQRRVSKPPFNVNWSLDQHCLYKYRLAERYPVNLATHHTAEADCLLTHYLFETFRRLAEGTYSADSPLQVQHG
jgi:hypothetical protein